MSEIANRFFTKGGCDPVIIRGTAKYAKLGSLDQWGKYSCCIYPDQESQTKIHKLISEGIKNKFRKDDEGQYCITFSRPEKIKVGTKGETVLPPVVVENAEGHVIKETYIEDGADITMKLECYGGKNPTGFGNYKAARLAGIRLHEKKAARSTPL